MARRLIGLAACAHQKREARVHFVVHHAADLGFGCFQNRRCSGDGDGLFRGANGELDIDCDRGQSVNGYMFC